jgi:hypothetical protein
LKLCCKHSTSRSQSRNDMPGPGTIGTREYQRASWVCCQLTHVHRAISATSE